MSEATHPWHQDLLNLLESNQFPSSEDSTTFSLSLKSMLSSTSVFACWKFRLSLDHLNYFMVSYPCLLSLQPILMLPWGWAPWPSHSFSGNPLSGAPTTFKIKTLPLSLEPQSGLQPGLCLSLLPFMPIPPSATTCSSQTMPSSCPHLFVAQI